MGRGLLFRNGTVLTADVARPVARAVAVEDGVIVALDDEALDYGSRGASEFDLAGGCLVPGFRDGHAHPLWGGIELGQVPLVGARTMDEVVERVRAYADAHPELEWIEGGGYDPTLVPKGVGDATVLDAAVADRPVVLEASDHHTMWVNSEALRPRGNRREHARPGARTDHQARRRHAGRHPRRVGRDRDGARAAARPRAERARSGSRARDGRTRAIGHHLGAGSGEPSGRGEGLRSPRSPR